MPLIIESKKYLVSVLWEEEKVLGWWNELENKFILGYKTIMDEFILLIEEIPIKKRKKYNAIIDTFKRNEKYDVIYVLRSLNDQRCLLYNGEWCHKNLLYLYFN